MVVEILVVTYELVDIRRSSPDQQYICKSLGVDKLMAGDFKVLTAPGCQGRTLFSNLAAV